MKRILARLALALHKTPVLIFLFLMLVAFAIVAPTFFQPSNLINVLRQASAIGILAVGQTIVVLVGGIDLSVASVMQLAGVTIAELTKGTNDVVLPVILMVMAMGAAIGAINGLLVTKRRVQPFIATLFVGLLVTGLRLWVTKATPSGILPPAVRAFGRGGIGPIPFAVLLFLAVAIAVGVVLSRTTYGRRIYAVGGNPRTAQMSGVRIDRITISAYVVCGMLAAVAGLVLVGYLGYADQEIGVGYDLDSIAAVVVGGAVLGGGIGSIAGTVAGVLLMTALLNMVLILNLPVQFQLVIRGGVILAAVSFYSAKWMLRVRTRAYGMLARAVARPDRRKGGA